jgi:flagellar motor switch protein FliM
MIRVKDICLKPVVGTWYEYKPQRENLTTDIGFGSLDSSESQEILDLHYRWGQRVVEILNANLAIASELHDSVIAIQRYGEFLSSHSGEAVSYTVRLSTGQEFLLLLDGLTVAALLNRATGGIVDEVKKNTDELTDIEQAILRPVVEDLLAAYKEQWLGALPSCEIVDIESPRLKPHELIKKETEVVSFAIRTAFGESLVVSGEIMMTGLVLEGLHEKYKIAKKRSPRKVTVYLSPEAITGVSVPVNVRIGTANVTMRDLLAMEPGDVLLLNERLSDSVFLTVAGETEFYGLLGKRQNRYAVKIIEKKAKYYDIPLNDVPEAAATYVAPAPFEQPKIVEQPRPEYIPQPAPEQKQVEVPFVKQEQTAPSPQKPFTPANEDAIKLEDTLLQEVHQATPHEEDDEFTWDLDDLK